MRGPRGPSSQPWRTFLVDHVAQFASCDFFAVPTATFRVLFVFVVLSHARRRILHVSVTAHPTAAWAAQQLREAFPWDTAPRFLLWDRDAIYGSAVRGTVLGMGIEEVLTAHRAPREESARRAPDRLPAPKHAAADRGHLGGLHHHYERRAA